jgi:hypothetical protein
MAAGSQAQGSWQNAKGSQIPAKSDFSELSSTEPDASATGSLLKNRVSHPYHATLHNLSLQKIAIPLKAPPRYRSHLGDGFHRPSSLICNMNRNDPPLLHEAFTSIMLY